MICYHKFWIHPMLKSQTLVSFWRYGNFITRRSYHWFTNEVGYKLLDCTKMTCLGETMNSVAQARTENQIVAELFTFLLNKQVTVQKRPSTDLLQLQVKNQNSKFIVHSKFGIWIFTSTTRNKSLGSMRTRFSECNTLVPLSTKVYYRTTWGSNSPKLSFQSFSRKKYQKYRKT